MYALARIAIASVVALAATWTVIEPVSAQSGTRTPLLMEKKKTLFQRVLTRPEAKLHDKPAGKPGAALAPMSALYVYDRKSDAAGEWLEVGPGSDGKTTGWLKAIDSVPWKQTLTLAFTNPANRERTLFFKEKAELQKLLESDQRAQQAAALRQRIVDLGQLPPDFPVISIEPSTHIDITKQFYLLPILEAGETYLSNNIKARMLRVASLTLKDEAEDPLRPKVRRNLYESLKNFRLGVVFVVDTTISMGPYLDRAREAAMKFYSSIERAGLKANYGLVAFRNSTEKTPGLEYLTKVFVQPKEAPDGPTFIAKLKELKATTVSSHSFAEDSIAGLKAAIDEIDWSPFDGRIVILITDAGALRSNDPASSTGLDIDRIRDLADTKKIHVMAVHLKTPAGRTDHSSAEKDYTGLTQGRNLPRALYYGIDAGDLAEFGRGVDGVAEGATTLLKAFAAGQAPPPPPAPPPRAGTGSRIQRDFQIIGNAMALAYLGAQQGTQAPRMFEAWVGDRDTATPTSAVFDVRLLLTRNQLSDLQETLKRIILTGRRSQIRPQGFFDELRSAAAAMSRDPARIGRRDTARLAEIGLMGEYLDDLPYRSELMGLDQDTWSSWSVAQQEDLLDRLEAKIKLYQRFHNEASLWIQLGGPGARPGDAVYPVPLDALP